jgi:hypothetical protein
MGALLPTERPPKRWKGLLSAAAAAPKEWATTLAGCGTGVDPRTVAAGYSK